MVDERILRIAQTGQIPMETPVANIMGQMRFGQPEDSSLWGKFKNWAGTNGGRMALGGLGTAAAVGLTGGNFKDALGYGVIGAGNTANNLYRHEQDAQKWADKDAQRRLYWQANEANRKLQQDLQTERLGAQKELAQFNYDKALGLLDRKFGYGEQAADNALARGDERIEGILAQLNLPEEDLPYAKAQMNGIDVQGLGQLKGNRLEQQAMNAFYDPNSTPEDRAMAEQTLKNIAEIKRNMATWSQPPLTLQTGANVAKGGNLALDAEAANQGQVKFLRPEQKLTGDAALIDLFMQNGDTLATAAARVGKMTPAEKIAMRAAEGQIDLGNNIALDNNKAKNQAYMAGINYDYSQQGADAALGRNMQMADYNAQIKEAAEAAAALRAQQFEGFKNSLPTTAQREIAAQAQALGISEEAIYQQLFDKNALANQKMRQENSAYGKPEFGQLATAVNNGVVAPQYANGLYGQEVFQAPAAKSGKQAENMRAQTAAVLAVSSQLGEFEKMFDALPQSKAAAYTGGFWRDMTGTLKPEESNFNTQRTLLFNKIARDLGGEKGVLSDQDIKRVEKALPTIYDNPEQRKAKMQAVRNLVNIRLQQINNGGVEAENAPDDTGNLEVGQIVDGYRYIGGNPSLESSWEAE